MFLRFLLLLAVVPLLELWLLMALVQRTSLGWTIAIVLSTGLIGMSLVRWQGTKALRQIQQQLSSGQSPSQAIVSGVMILVAGALLLTPGIITDTVGFLLLIPPVRIAIAGYLQKRLIGKVANSVQGSVWVGSFGTNFSPTPETDPSQTSERPGVLVVEPDDPKLLND